MVRGECELECKELREGVTAEIKAMEREVREVADAMRAREERKDRMIEDQQTRIREMREEIKLLKSIIRDFKEKGEK